MNISLKSEGKLQMPKKALSILGTYLSECLDKSYLSPNGKQLFKMSVVSDADVDSNGIIDSDDNLSLEEFKSLSVDDKLVEIYKLLTRR